MSYDQFLNVAIIVGIALIFAVGYWIDRTPKGGTS